jgi:hypothetical protein
MLASRNTYYSYIGKVLHRLLSFPLVTLTSARQPRSSHPTCGAQVSKLGVGVALEQARRVAKNLAVYFGRLKIPCYIVAMKANAPRGYFVTREVSTAPGAMRSLENNMGGPIGTGGAIDRNNYNYPVMIPVRR